MWKRAYLKFFFQNVVDLLLSVLV